MPQEKQVEKILARLSLEFVENARDQLEDIETRIDWLDSGRAIDANDLYDIQRNIHNIKGQGSTFGYPLIGRIAHMLEDYLENVGGVHRENVKDLRAFVEVMTDILAFGENFDADEVEAILRSLPSGRPTSFSAQEIHDVNVLLVMPKGLQRKMVAQELLSCGFDVNRAYDTLEALSVALDIKPEIVFVNYDMTPFSGTELANVFASIDKLKDTHIVLFTSYDQGDAHVAGLPDSVSVVEKRKDFTESLGELLLEWGVFGKIAS